MTDAAAADTRHACSQCGHLQPGAERCERCGYDVMLDVARASVRDLLRENEARARERFDDRLRLVAVAGGIGLVVLCWFIPGWWRVRRLGYAMPFLLDQILLMVGAAFLADKLLGRLRPRSRYPWLDHLPPPTRP